MNAFFLRTTLVFAVIFLLPLGLLAETNTDDGTALSDSVMPVSSYDGELQTDGHNPNYMGCNADFEICRRFGVDVTQCEWQRTACLFACDVDQVASGSRQGIRSCYQAE